MANATDISPNRLLNNFYFEWEIGWYLEQKDSGKVQKSDGQFRNTWETNNRKQTEITSISPPIPSSDTPNCVPPPPSSGHASDYILKKMDLDDMVDILR